MKLSLSPEGLKHGTEWWSIHLKLKMRSSYVFGKAGVDRMAWQPWLSGSGIGRNDLDLGQRKHLGVGLEARQQTPTTTQFRPEKTLSINARWLDCTVDGSNIAPAILGAATYMRGWIIWLVALGVRERERTVHTYDMTSSNYCCWNTGG